MSFNYTLTIAFEVPISISMKRPKFQDVGCQGNLKFCQGIVREMSGNFVSSGVWQPCYITCVTEICKLNIKDEENLRIWFSPTS